jgi:four helix bundle protein
MRIVREFPEHERYALRDNMTRAARSATHNIAEGFGRYHYQSNIQFCRQSRGSLYELVDQLITAHDEGYISEAEMREGKLLITRSLELLNGFIRYLMNAKEGSITNNEQRVTP